MNKIFKWLENYWYHYKWVTLIVAVFAAIIIFCVVSVGDGIEDDIHILYAGPDILTDTQLERMEQAFADILKEDHNEDGEKSVSIVDITIMSDEQLEAAQAAAKEQGETIIYDPNLRNQALSQIKNLMSTGAVIICLVDPYVYESCEEGTFVTLESVLGNTPEFSYDDYSIRFSDTALKSAYDCFSVLSDDILLCIRNDIVITSNSKHFKNEYAWHKTYFKDFIGFSLS